ncbi:hypothetical protein [Spirosoma panaciterrae]|uniref:hypothetical protein n=1 Tax=Spirosoma panaciterrae TaxID=496058 RepID=UPI000365FA24|nr:hypothetical protein [Spirosoma panaciterrae]
MAYSVPILIILFNRPDNAQKLINQLRTIKPSNLFIAIDGPRVNKPSDKEGVEACVRLLDTIEWPCQINKKISPINLGCGENVSGAINWFFSEIEEGIILEDDCIPSEAFFNFCEFQLKKYRYEPQIMMISGNRWNDEFPIHTDYFYSMFTSTWGWATWRRAWQYYDYRMSDWPAIKTSKDFQDWLKLPEIKAFWLNKLNSYYQHISIKISNWDFQWQYTVFKKKGLVITPTENLVQNIGTEGVHTYASQEGVHFKPTTKASFKITKEPQIIAPNYSYDKYHSQKLLNQQPTIYSKLKFGFKQILALDTTYLSNQFNKLFH